MMSIATRTKEMIQDRGRHHCIVGRTVDSLSFGVVTIVVIKMHVFCGLLIPLRFYSSLEDYKGQSCLECTFFFSGQEFLLRHQ